METIKLQYSKIHNWLSGLSILSVIILKSAFTNKNIDHIEIVLSIIILFLIPFSIGSIFLRESGNRGNLFFSFSVKSLSEIRDESNLSEFIKLFFLLWAFIWLKPLGIFGFIVFSIFSVPLFLFFISTSIRELLVTREFTGLVIGFFLLSLFLFIWEKNYFVKYYGNETIGSYLQKPEYRTKYLVNVYPSHSSSKKYNLPADIHVYTKTFYDDYPSEDLGGEYFPSYSGRIYHVERIFFSKGRSLRLDNCYLTLREKVFCYDYQDGEWYIELTEIKP